MMFHVKHFGAAPVMFHVKHFLARPDRACKITDEIWFLLRKNAVK
mgnify:CR=1 FL=1